MRRPGLTKRRGWGSSSPGFATLSAGAPDCSTAAGVTLELSGLSDGSRLARLFLLLTRGKTKGGDPDGERSGLRDGGRREDGGRLGGLSGQDLLLLRVGLQGDLPEGSGQVRDGRDGREEGMRMRQLTGLARPLE